MYTEKQIQAIKENLRPIDCEERARELLDVDGPIQIGNLTFDASRIVEELDPIAFNCMVSEISDIDDLTEVYGEYYDSQELEEFIQELEEQEENETEEE